MKTTVLPLEPASTELVGVVSVPEPSAELVTLTDGDAPIAVSAPPAVLFCFAENVAEPIVEDDVAPA